MNEGHLPLDNGIVYVTVNIINGKLYVGIHNGGNKYYLGSGRLLKQAIKKYGRENFSRLIIDEFDSLSVGVEKEKFWIRRLNTKTPNGYNLSDGGFGLSHHTEETKARISEAGRGRRASPEARHKMSLAQLGNQHALGRIRSPESRARMSLAQIGNKKNAGRVFTNETREKISNSLAGNKNRLGRKHSEETKKKIGAANKGREVPAELRGRLSMALKGKPWSFARRLADKRNDARIIQAPTA